jgi:chromosomal replication initiator protein
MPAFTDQQVIDAFQRALAAPRLSSAQYVQGWVRRIECRGLDAEGKVVLAVATRFNRDFISDHFLEDILAEMEIALGSKVEVVWQVDEALKAESPEAPEPPEPPFKELPSAEPAVNTFDPKLNFDTFVAAPSNQLAFAGALAVADKPGAQFNPLFIYGGSGLGKTHLLHAIGNRLLQTDPTRRVLYLSSEEFTNEFIGSVRDHRMPEFRRKYRQECDCLLIDDIQFLGSKEQTQEEFFHTFNSLFMSGRAVVITSDAIPFEIPGLAERLRTRFAGGLTADIQEPDFETRVAILKKKAEGLDFPLSDDVAKYIAGVIHKNVRELQAALNRLFACYSLSSQPVTVELAAHILKNVLPAAKPLSLEEIGRTVAKYFSVTFEDLRGPRRQKKIAHARHVALYFSRSMLKASFPEIGDFFNRDHSTVMTSFSKVEEELPVDLQLKKEIDELRSRLAR